MIRRPKSENEPDASDFTTRSLLMIGPTHFFVLYVPARLPGKLSGISGGLPGDPTLFAILFESSAYCPDRCNLFLCLLLLSKTKAPGPVASLDSLSQRPRLLLRDENYRSNRGAQHCGTGRVRPLALWHRGSCSWASHFRAAMCRKPKPIDASVCYAHRMMVITISRK